MLKNFLVVTFRSVKRTIEINENAVDELKETAIKNGGRK